MTALDRIRDEISRTGPIPFDRFMEIALYDAEHGYFTSGRLRSDRAGDFLTSPEVSPLFGETIARFVDAERALIGSPFTLVEAGAGSGSLVAALLGALHNAPDRVVAVEVSAAARTALAARVPAVEVVDSLEDVGEVRGVIVANELLDNLPTAVAVRSGPGWMERVVSDGPDGLGYRLAEARPEVADWADRHAGPVDEGAVVEVQLAAGEWVRTALERLDAGALLAFDYGDTAEGLASRRTAGTIRTYRGHHLGPDPLAEPGGTDITLDVDFGALLSVAVEAGAEARVVRQDEFLAAWGLGERLDRLRAEEREAARAGDAMRRLALRSDRTDGETLLHPRGLGDFRVLVARR